VSASTQFHFIQVGFLCSYRNRNEGKHRTQLTIDQTQACLLRMLALYCCS